MQPINPDAFETELDERRRVMQQDVRTPRPAMRTRVLVVMLLAALAAVVGAASFDARRARGHVEDAAAWDRAAAEAGLQSDTSWPPRLGAVLVAAHLGQLQRQRW